MKIGLAKEVKKHEYRVGLTPASAAEYVTRGHEVIVEKSAGEGSGFADADYQEVGCTIAANAEAVFADTEMIVKVKEPLPEEYALMRSGQILYTYLHLAANKELTETLLARKISGIAYETIVEADGSLPCLAPMSQIAGRLSIQEGTKYLEKEMGGRGVLLGGVPGVYRGEVVILGAGVAGSNACQTAIGLGANVTVLDISAKRLVELDALWGNRVQTLYATPSNIAEAIRHADLVIGAVLVPGGAAPRLVTRKMLKTMKRGAVMVDIAIDQGGCFETSHQTYHDAPVYEVEGILHYCVGNMPGAVSLTSTLALNGATNRYGLLIADLGLEAAMKASEPLRYGLNCHAGKLTNKPVADALGLPYEAYSG